MQTVNTTPKWNLHFRKFCKLNKKQLTFFLVVFLRPAKWRSYEMFSVQVGGCISVCLFFQSRDFLLTFQMTARFFYKNLVLEFLNKKMPKFGPKYSSSSFMKNRLGNYFKFLHEVAATLQMYLDDYLRKILFQGFQAIRAQKGPKWNFPNFMKNRC